MSALAQRSQFDDSLITLQLVKEYERGDIGKIDWLDRMAFRQIEKVHAVRTHLTALVTVV